MHSLLKEGGLLLLSLLLDHNEVRDHLVLCADGALRLLTLLAQVTLMVMKRQREVGKKAFLDDHLIACTLLRVLKPKGGLLLRL